MAIITLTANVSSASSTPDTVYMVELYPSISLSIDSYSKVNDGRFTVRGASGIPGTGSNVTSIAYNLTLVHSLISGSDKDTLESFYDSNRQTDDIGVQWIDGITYRGAMTSYQGWMIQSNLYYVEVQFVGLAL